MTRRTVWVAVLAAGLIAGCEAELELNLLGGGNAITHGPILGLSLIHI